MNSLLDEREKRYERRKKYKKQIDDSIDLSYKDEVVKLSMPQKKLDGKSVRLLDEGAVVGDGWVNFFIQKGTIEKFLNGENTHLDNIDDSFVGHVDLGHMDFAVFPFILGEWTKKDLKLVDIENGRHALDININLDDESMFVKELQRQPYDIGISAEFFFHVNQDATEELSEELGEYTEVVDEILITGYGLVGECGNVNSDGLELKGGQSMTKEIKLAMEQGEEQTPETTEVEISDENESKELDLVEEVEAEESDEESEEETEEQAEEESEEVEEVEVEEDEDDESEVEEDEDEEDEENELEAAFNDLTTAYNALKEENLALRKKNKKLAKKLANKNEEIADFASKFKGLSVELGLKKETKKEVATAESESPYASGDGIGV